MIKLLQNLFQDLRSIVTQIWAFIAPPYRFSWETLFLLSIFSCLIAGLSKLGQATNRTTLFSETIASTTGLIFLLLTVAWFTTENPIKAFGLNWGHWITGALLAWIIFGNWAPINPQLLAISLPLFAALTSTVSEFVNPDLRLQKLNVSAYQRILIRSFSYGIISSWIAFGFTVQGWLGEYPSLLADDLSQSGFLQRVATWKKPQSRGVEMLEQAARYVDQRADGQSWSEVERWLLGLRREPEFMDLQVKARISDSPENKLWQIDTLIESIGNPEPQRRPAYLLSIFAIWKGPGSRPRGYTLQRDCQLIQQRRVHQDFLPDGVADDPVSQLAITTQVECGAIAGPEWILGNAPPG